MSQYPPFVYTIYRIFTHLLIPFATIPIGILFYYFSTATLPATDIAIIFHTDSDIWPSIATAIIIAPIYYIHCLFNRSELSKQWQFGIHSFFILFTLAWMFYLCYRTESHFGTWTEESGRLDPIFLFTIPQIIATYVVHWFWVHKYRNTLYLKWFPRTKPTNNTIDANPEWKVGHPNRTEQKKIKTREEAIREFNEALERSDEEDEKIKEWLNKLPIFDMAPMLPSFRGKKIWETVIFKQNIDSIGWHKQNDDKSLIAYNSPNRFCIVDTNNGQITQRIEPNFNEIWNDDNKTYLELSEKSRELIESNHVIKKSYWQYRNNGIVHSSFDPYAHYDDGSGLLRLRKTVYFKGILSKDHTLIAYINKGKEYTLIEIRRMQDHSLVQTINTYVPGTHDCRFIRNNHQLIVACDDGSIKIFDITSGERVFQMMFGHTDSVLCLDVDTKESRIVSGSADGFWKKWSIELGDTFGDCLYTSEQFITTFNKPIPIYHAVFSPDNQHLIIITDIGRIRIYHLETLQLQTTIYDKYQRHSASTDEPTLLSILVDSDENCFYIGYANGKMQKWV